MRRLFSSRISVTKTHAEGPTYHFAAGSSTRTPFLNFELLASQFCSTEGRVSRSQSHQLRAYVLTRLLQAAYQERSHFPVGFVIACYQCVRFAFYAGTARSPDTMRVCLDISRNVVRDNSIYRGNVEAACCNICRDQDFDILLTETFQYSHSIRLIHIAVKELRVDLQEVVKVLCKLFGASDIFDEHEQLTFLQHCSNSLR